MSTGYCTTCSPTSSRHLPLSQSRRWIRLALISARREEQWIGDVPFGSFHLVKRMGLWKCPTSRLTHPACTWRPSLTNPDPSSFHRLILLLLLHSRRHSTCAAAADIRFLATKKAPTDHGTFGLACLRAYRFLHLQVSLQMRTR